MDIVSERRDGGGNRSGEPVRPVVSIENLRVEFDTDDGPVVGVKDVSFSIAPGETVCVVGESGSGKSVTSLALMRLVEFGGGRITGGSLRFARPGGEEIDVAGADPSVMQAIRGGEIGMIFQEPMTSLNPVFTIGSQLTDGLRVHRGLRDEDARARALELLRGVRMPEPERRLKQYPHELSGGMRQRVVIAMAMACEPRLLIADEPTTALDVTIQAEILALIDRLKRENGMAVLFITHDMAVVAQMADKVVVMYRGSVVERGSVEQIFENPREDYTRMLLAAVPRLGEMRGRPAPEPMRVRGSGPADTRASAGSPTGGPATKPSANPSANPSAKPSAKPLLEVRNLCTRFPVKGGVLRRTIANVHAVEDVSFSLSVGETLSLVGESGCGKSSCGRSILRLVEAHSGDIQLDGWEIRRLGPLDLRRARRDMQMIFQDPFASLNPYRRLKDQVAEPLLNFRLASGSELDDRVATLFDRVELPRSFLRRYPHELSGGQRQRVAIARAIAPNPKLVIADEAVSALDVSVQAQVLNLLMELQADLGLSFLFISHDMAVVERVSHQVGVMYLGRIVELGPRGSVFEDPRHPYTRSLLSAVPIADPRRKRIHDAQTFKPIPSPIRPLGDVPEPSTYDEVAPGHYVLRE
ncbi:MAG: dipeptide ABC transporter ATP-binding protein [Microvirga sp.]